MKNYFLELIKAKTLKDGQTVEIFLKSGKNLSFVYPTDNFDLCLGFSYITFTKNNVEYVINCSEIEMVTLS